MRTVLNGVTSSSEEAREDALAAILNFSSRTEGVLEFLTHTNLMTFSIASYSFSQECLSLAADIASNFLLASGSIALHFIRSVWMHDLVEMLEFVPFKMRQKIARCFFIVYQRYSEHELIEVALEFGRSGFEAVCDCFYGAEADLIIGAIRGIRGIFAYYMSRPENENCAAAIEVLLQRDWSMIDGIILEESLPSKVFLELNDFLCKLGEFASDQGS
jgi:hypothetical protein